MVEAVATATRWATWREAQSYVPRIASLPGVVHTGLSLETGSERKTVLRVALDCSVLTAAIPTEISWQDQGVRVILPVAIVVA